jgi:protein-histidine pros-kinase
MKLILKFNLVFLAIFLIGLGSAGYVSNRLLQDNAREETLQNARLVMEAALAARAYTSSQIRPLLAPQLQHTFLPQVVAAYAAKEIIGTMRTKYSDYAYKEATLNPTNPRDRAAEWEVEIINQFRVNPDRGEIIGERDTLVGRSLFIARPIQIKDSACLPCHSTVEAAPKTMLDKYGPLNGFGWQLNEVVGAQVLSVPTDVPARRATAAFHTFMISLTAVFLMIGVAGNLMMHWMVIRPVVLLSKLADEVSLGKTGVPDFEVRSKDEIGVLVDSFNRMKKSIEHALRMLE